MKDMGPFAGMDAALERAITAYGTSPVRQMVTVNVENVGHHSFDGLPTTPQDWIDWINAARNETPEEYRANLNCVLNWESGYYDSGDSATFSIWYERPETDAEMTERVNRGIAYVRGCQAAERRTYETLKQKYETA